MLSSKRISPPGSPEFFLGWTVSNGDIPKVYHRPMMKRSALGETHVAPHYDTLYLLDGDILSTKECPIARQASTRSFDKSAVIKVPTEAAWKIANESTALDTDLDLEVLPTDPDTAFDTPTSTYSQGIY